MRASIAFLFSGALVLAAGQIFAQRPAGALQSPARVSAQAAAPVDITGYWVSLVTEDWRYRMVAPPKGDYGGVPLNSEGRAAADRWDPDKDDASGGQCKTYGAAGVLRIPGRIHIHWQDADTLQVDTDAGSQTRLLAFGGTKSHGGDWQGISAAAWDRPGSPMGFPLGLGAAGGPSPGGSLKVVTTQMKPGYLRKNGVPYSSSAVLTEYFDRLDVPGGDSLLVVTTELVDPAYLSSPFWTSTHFKKQPDAAGWNPTPCSAR